MKADALRDDLSGLDVARKALILARELGLPLELEQIRGGMVVRNRGPMLVSPCVLVDRSVISARGNKPPAPPPGPWIGRLVKERRNSPRR